MKSERRAELPCPACGGRSYSRGRLNCQGIRFVADSAPFWRRWFGMAGNLPARRCDDCGNIQIFSEPRWERTTGRGRDADFE